MTVKQPHRVWNHNGTMIEGTLCQVLTRVVNREKAVACEAREGRMAVLRSWPGEPGDYSVVPESAWELVATVVH